MSYPMYVATFPSIQEQSYNSNKTLAFFLAWGERLDRPTPARARPGDRVVLITRLPFVDFAVTVVRLSASKCFHRTIDSEREREREGERERERERDCSWRGV